jgi:hypothetical protein
VRWDVERRDVRLDPAIMHEPVQHLGRTMGAVADQALGIQVEVFQRSTKRRIVEDGEIFLNCPSRCFRRQTCSTFDAVAVAGVGLDQTGVDGKAFVTDRPSAMQRCSTLSNRRRSSSLS